MATDLTPGTITTLGALRPGDVGVFVRADGDGEPFVVLDLHPAHEVTHIHKVTDYLPYWADWEGKSVRYLGRGRIEPARIVMEGEPDRVAELEEQVRTLREFVHECATDFDCDRDAHRYQTFCRQCEARAALAATAPKEKPCTT